MSGDEVVQAVEERRWKAAQQDGCPPRPPQFVSDEEQRTTPADAPRVAGPVVRHHMKGRQLVRVTPEPHDRRPSGRTLERGKCEDGGAIVLEEELDSVAAQPAHTVVEDEMGVPPGGHWRGRLSHVLI